MKTPLQDRCILLGVTGSIAAYKAAELASKLTQAGCRVEVILTQAALQFITPLTFQSVTGQRAYTDADLWGREGHVRHIGLGQSGDLLVVAPASANTIAKLAHGIADNLLTVTALAARCPLMLAPAMDAGMYAHPATQANLDILRQRGAIVIGPLEGHLASGLVGLGRMVEPAELMGHIRLVLARGGSLEGRKVVVTAGGTQEPLDPVRFLANRSSGKQGYALAQAALDRGAEVVLISAPTHLNPPSGARCVQVNTAQEMLESVLAELPQTDVLIMAAAVADFRPIAPADYKIKRGSEVPEVRLEATPDILAAVAEFKQRTHLPRLTIGFAAETHDLLTYARIKLQAKKLDMLVANDITAPDAGFAVDTNRVILLDARGGEEHLPLLSKAEVADRILERVVALLQEQKSD